MILQKEFQDYTDWCNECDIEMTRRSKDGRQIFCDNCFVPKPVPLTHLPTHAKLDEVKRLKRLADEREAILAN
jgi:hypothetical protein